MIWIFILIAILIIGAVILSKLSRKGADEHADYPYQKAGAIFTSAERSFYGILNKVVGENAKVFGKVRVADVVVPRKGLSRVNWQKAFNKVSGKHFDFLLCSNDSLSIICAIELDDSSHESKNRQKRDEFLSGVCTTVEIPLIKIPAKAGYVIDEVKQVLAPYLRIVELPKKEEKVALQESAIGKKVCPRCSSPMVKRVAKKGSNAGKQFWACSSYPKCKYIEAIQA